MATPRETARRMLGELLIIVVGVLTAFQVEGWRDEAELREREAVQLDALRRDFEVTRELIQGAISDQEDIVEAVRQLTLIANGDAAAPTDDSLSVLFLRAQMFHRLEPVTGAYEALVSSGDLRLLRSNDLRSELAQFSGALGEGYEDAALADAIHSELLIRTAGLVPLVHAMPPSVGDGIGFDGERHPVDFTAVLEDQQVMGLIFIAGAVEAGHLSYFERLDQQAEAILDLLGPLE